MGLMADIFRSSDEDFSNGGVSSVNDRVYIVNAEGPNLGEAHFPYVILKRGAFNSVIAVPEDAIKKGIHTMAGGTFIHSHDSRFTSAIEKLIGYRFYGAVSFHDRIE